MTVRSSNSSKVKVKSQIFKILNVIPYFPSLRFFVKSSISKNKAGIGLCIHVTYKLKFISCRKFRNST